MSNKTRILYLLFFSLVLGVNAQENYFGDIVFEKNFSKSENWNHIVSGHLKHFFHEEEGWYRFGGSYTANRKLGEWGLQAGLVNEYTFDNNIENFSELRPWLGITLNSAVIGKLYFMQLVKFEWRNLFFTESESIITTRTRYRIMPYYVLDSDWTFYTSYEWYILPNAELGARFINSREWKVGVSKKLKTLTLNLSYTRERYNEVLLPDSFEANTIALAFIF